MLKCQTRVSVNWPGKDIMSKQMLEEALSKAYDELSKWQSPESFVARVEAVDQLLESPILFSKTNLNFVFDAFTLSALPVRERSGPTDSQARPRCTI
jgi:hypothetical protein